MGNNLINFPLPFTTGNRWGFPSRHSIVRTSWETDSIDDNSDEVPELIWTTHLNKGISVSDNEIACNWILKKIYNTHWHSDTIILRILIGSYQGFLICRNWFLSTRKCGPGISTDPAYFMNPMSLRWIQWVWVKYILLCNSFVFSCIESIFGMEVLWYERHQPQTS